MADLADLLVRMSLAVSAALLVVMALRAPIRKIGGPSIAYGLWALVPLAMLSVFLPGPTNLGLFRQIELARPVMAAAEAVRSISTATAQGGFAAPATAAGSNVPWLWLWLAGALALVLRLMWLELRLARHLSRLRADPAQAGVYYLDGEDLGPMVVGLWRSKIILPADFPERYEGEERELILAHERAHVRGGHLITGGLAYGLMILQWFNPLAHLAIRLFRVDQELACDAMVVARYPDKRAVYARAMFKTGMSNVSAPLACGWSRGSSNPVRRRIAALRGAAPGRARRVVSAALTVFTVGMGSVLTYAAIAAPATAKATTVIERAVGLAPVGGSKIALQTSRSVEANAKHPSAAQNRPSIVRSGPGQDAAIDQYLQANPQERSDGIDPNNFQNFVGVGDFRRLVDDNRKPATLALRENVAGPLSFVVPAGMNRDDAARTVGLTDASGYGADRAAPSGQTVMVMCNTPQTPASVRCR